MIFRNVLLRGLAANYSMNQGTPFKTIYLNGFVATFALVMSCTAGRADGFYASNQSGVIEQITSGGAVSTFATFLGSSDIPQGLALTPGGTLYIANSGDGVMWQVPPNGVLRPWVSVGVESGSLGLVLGANGNLFTAVDGQHIGLIDEISQAGTISTFGSLPTGAQPFGLAFDSSGNLLVSDSGPLHCIYQITPGGAVTVFATLPEARLLTGLAVGPGGNLFVADFSENSVYEVTPGGTVITYAILPSGAGLKGLAFDNSGNLYVSEQSLNEIVKISPGGVISNFASMYAPGFLLATPEPTALSFFTVGLLALVLRQSRKQRNQRAESKAGNTTAE